MLTATQRKLFGVGGILAMVGVGFFMHNKYGISKSDFNFLKQIDRTPNFEEEQKKLLKHGQESYDNYGKWVSDIHHLNAMQNFQQIKEKMERIENGILKPVQIKGEKLSKMKLMDRMNHYKVPGIIISIIENNEIEWTKGYGVSEVNTSDSITKNSLFCAGTAGNLLGYMASLSLFDSKKLNIDQDVNDVISENKLPFPGITLKKILKGNSKLELTVAKSSKIRDLISNLKLNPLYEKNSRYSVENSVLIQHLIENITSKPFDSVMKDMVLKPLHVYSSSYSIDPKFEKNYTKGHSKGLVVESIDNNISILNFWTNNEDFSQIFLELLSSPFKKNGHFPHNIFDYINDGEHEMVQIRGESDGHRCVLIGYPFLGKGAIIMTNSKDSEPLEDEILRSIAKLYRWKSKNFQLIEKKKIEINEERLNEYYGDYKNDQNVFRILKENKKIILNLNQDQKVEIFAENEKKFFSLDGDEIEFLPNGFLLNKNFYERIKPQFP